MKATTKYIHAAEKVLKNAPAYGTVVGFDDILTIAKQSLNAKSMKFVKSQFTLGHSCKFPFHYTIHDDIMLVGSYLQGVKHQEKTPEIDIPLLTQVIKEWRTQSYTSR